MTVSDAIPPLADAPVARSIGGLLSGAFALGQRLRHPRPIHSRSVVLSGAVTWIPCARRSGISWIDSAPTGPVPVVARLSRSLGLPAPLPDIIGLALRVDADGRAGDIEFASTGWGLPARFALVPHRRAERARFGIVLPYRGPRGPVLLGARTRAGRPPATDPAEVVGDLPTEPWTLTLAHATPLGAWHPFALLDLRLDPDQDDRGLRFDTVRHPIRGTRAYTWVRAARQPSYVRVQGADEPIRMPPPRG